MFSDHSRVKSEINNRRKTGSIHKFVDIKEYTSKKPVDQRSHKGNYKILGDKQK